MNYEHPFPRVSRYERVCNIMKVDITEFRVCIWEMYSLRGEESVEKHEKKTWQKENTNTTYSSPKK